LKIGVRGFVAALDVDFSLTGFQFFSGEFDRRKRMRAADFFLIFLKFERSSGFSFLSLGVV
jgi:hypothetical protein